MSGLKRDTLEKKRADLQEQLSAELRGIKGAATADPELLYFLTLFKTLQNLPGIDDTKADYKRNEYREAMAMLQRSTAAFAQLITDLANSPYAEKCDIETTLIDLSLPRRIKEHIREVKALNYHGLTPVGL